MKPDIRAFRPNFITQAAIDSVRADEPRYCEGPKCKHTELLPRHLAHYCSGECMNDAKEAGTYKRL